MEAAYPNGPILRSTQTKSHGCVRAEFIVEDDVPEDLRHGLFAAAATYPAVVRFANQSPTPQADIEKDIRGMSIKVCGVSGALQPDGSTSCTDQDFLLISSDVFTARDTRSFLDLRRASEPRNLRKLVIYFFNPFEPHLREFRNVLRSFRRHSNPLRIRYFSATPFRFGAGAAKFCASPRVGSGGALPAEPSDDFLREALEETLHRQDVYFDFMVQLQTDPRTMPVEDPSRPWDEGVSPFRRVATLRIPRQRTGSADQRAFCEALTFNPWRGLPDHRPLGQVNRSRHTIYLALSAHRRTRSATGRHEPTCAEMPPPPTVPGESEPP